MPPGTLRHFEVRVENLGDELWRPADGAAARDPPRMALARLAHGPAPARGGPFPVPGDCAAGPQHALAILVRTPSVPGPYALELDVVHEHVRWFDCMADVPVMVDPAAATADAGRPASKARTEWEPAAGALRSRVRQGAARLRTLGRSRAG